MIPNDGDGDDGDSDDDLFYKFTFYLIFRVTLFSSIWCLTHFPLLPYVSLILFPYVPAALKINRRSNHREVIIIVLDSCVISHLFLRAIYLHFRVLPENLMLWRRHTEPEEGGLSRQGLREFFCPQFGDRWTHALFTSVLVFLFSSSFSVFCPFL